jgi:hypothetical protein
MPDFKCGGCGKEADGCVHMEITLSYPIYVIRETSREEVYVCKNCVDKMHKFVKHAAKQTVKGMTKNLG